MNLRAACIHGRYEAHSVANHQGIDSDVCPGGRVVTIDYEAAKWAIPDSVVYALYEALSLAPSVLARWIVDAALADSKT